MEAIELFHGEDLADRTTLATFGDISAAARVVAPAALCGTGIPLTAEKEIRWIMG